MVLLEFAMAPHGQGESLSAHVARILDVIDKSGLPFKALQADCPRVGMNLKVDYRAGPESRLRSKIEKVEAHLGRRLAT